MTGKRWRQVCSHLWREVGPAPAYSGQACRLWRCDHCGKDWELFVGYTPSTGHLAIGTGKP